MQNLPTATVPASRDTCPPWCGETGPHAVHLDFGHPALAGLDRWGRREVLAATEAAALAARREVLARRPAQP